MKNFYTHHDIHDLQQIGVYLIYCNIVDTYYIGSTSSIKNKAISKKGFLGRWNHHLNCLKNNKHGNVYLQNAYNKYGINSFQFIILEVTSKEDCTNREQFWLDEYKKDKKVFNIQPICNNPGYYHRTTEIKQKLSTLYKGKKRDKSIFRNILKPVVQYTKQMIFVADFTGIAEAGRQTNIQRQDIGKCCLGKLPSAGGFIWKYKDNEISYQRKYSKWKLNIKDIEHIQLLYIQGKSVKQIHEIYKDKVSLSTITKTAKGERNKYVLT